MKAAQGSYLIAGRPRCRTAWLAALLSDEIVCYHDDPLRLPELIAAGKPFGFSSPSLVVTDPERALEVFQDSPIVVIDRPASESWPALARWAGFDLPGWPQLEQRYQWFLAHAPRERLLTVPYKALERYDAVNAIKSHCLKSSLCHDRYRVFDGLRIEQHRDKAALRTPLEPEITWHG